MAQHPPLPPVPGAVPLLGGGPTPPGDGPEMVLMNGQPTPVRTAQLMLLIDIREALQKVLAAVQRMEDRGQVDRGK